MPVRPRHLHSAAGAKGIMNEVEETQHGEKLLSAVERILADDQTILRIVEEHRRKVPSMDDHDMFVRAVGESLVKTYSTKSAISGGATALPAVLPGFGTLATLTGGTLVDMALMLKYEVEMCLALSWLYGFDIRRREERQIALLLASVNTYEVQSGRNYFVDLASAETTAIWNYAPRELSKLVLQVMGKLAILSVGKGLARALPLVGIAIGSSVNKVLTTRVGKRCIEEVSRRRTLLGHEVIEEYEDVVEAKVKPKKKTKTTKTTKTTKGANTGKSTTTRKRAKTTKSSKGKVA